MKPVIISEDQWIILIEELHKDYPTSVLAIREKTKKVLGFTSRQHRSWIDNPLYNEFVKTYGEAPDHNMNDGIYMIPPHKGNYINMIHLDFYSEPKRTFFLLKYSEFLK